MTVKKKQDTWLQRAAIREEIFHTSIRIFRFRGRKRLAALDRIEKLKRRLVERA